MDLSDHPAYRLVIDHARALGQGMAEQVRADLEWMDETLLSGPDSRLISVWQEICVQVQGEESFEWDTYQELVTGMIGSRVADRSKAEQGMLWLASSPGLDWLYEVVNAGDEPAPEHLGVDTEELAAWIWVEFLRPLAESERDPNVIGYLEGEEWSGDDDEDLEEDDEDQDENPDSDEDEG